MVKWDAQRGRPVYSLSIIYLCFNSCFESAPLGSEVEISLAVSGLKPSAYLSEPDQDVWLCIVAFMLIFKGISFAKPAIPEDHTLKIIVC